VNKTSDYSKNLYMNIFRSVTGTVFGQLPTGLQKTINTINNDQYRHYNL